MYFNLDTVEIPLGHVEPTWNERDWTYPPVEGKNGYIAAASLATGPSSTLIPDTTDVYASPFYDVPRTLPGTWPTNGLGTEV